MAKLYAPGAEPLPQLASAPDHLSFSQITALSKRYARSCPRSWAYDKLLGATRVSKPAPGMLVGLIIDRSIQAYWGSRLIGDKPELVRSTTFAEADRQIAKAAGGWREPAKSSAYITMALECLEAVYEYVNSTEGLPLGVQTKHAWLCDNGVGYKPIKVIGNSDWIEADGTIVDLKYSGRASWNSNGEWNAGYVQHVTDQLFHYYLGRRWQVFQVNQGRRALGQPELEVPAARGKIVCVTHAINRKAPEVRDYVIEFDLSMYTEIADSVREAYAAQHSPKHPPRPGDACDFCPYVARCQRDNERYTVRTGLLADPNGEIGV